MRCASNETLDKAIALKVPQLQLFKEKNRVNIAKLNVSFWLVPNFGRIVLKIQARVSDFGNFPCIHMHVSC